MNTIQSLYFQKLRVLILLVTISLLTACGSSQGEDKYMGYPIPIAPLQEMIYNPTQTQFSVWAPDAEEVRVLIYHKGEDGHAEQMHNLDKNEDTGLWTTVVSGDLMGLYYTFNIKINEVWQGDTPGIMAKAVAVNGKRAAIIDWAQTNPAGWAQDTLPRFTKTTDAILYELHPRTFTIAPSSNVADSVKGKFLGIVAHGVFKDYENISTALDHIKDLGVTHVKLMPSFDFTGKDERFHTEENFSWGYDPLNYNIPEGLYSTNPFDPYTRIKEFKEMVLKLHKAGLRVIMDVSYAYSTPALSGFEKTAPGYFFRQDKDGNYPLADNGKVQIASHRPFVLEYMKESMRFWIEEYHIDGFSLDALDLYDTDALAEIENELKKVKPSVFIMGEAQNTIDRIETSKKNDIAELMHTYSLSISGNLQDSIGSSFLLGHLKWVEEFKSGLLGSIESDAIPSDSIPSAWRLYNHQPSGAINYLSSHDGFSLTDFLNKHTSAQYYNNEKVRLSKLAYTALFTSQGVPMLYAGEEFMQPQQKADSPKNNEGKALDWDLKASNWDHYQYIKGLIQLRKKHPAFRIDDANLLRKQVEFLPTEKPLVVAYRLKDYANKDEWEDILVIYNAGKDAVRVNIPEGRYIVVCKDGYINENGLSYAYGQAFVSGQSAMILYRTDKQVYIPQSAPVETSDASSQEENIRKEPQINLNLTPIKKENNSIIHNIQDVKID